MSRKLRSFFVILLAALLLALCGCSRFETPEHGIAGVIGSGTGPDHSTITYSISPNSMVLTYDGVNYPYEISHSDDSITYTVKYPNGGIYYETRGDGTGTGGWNDRYDIGTKYTSGDELVELLSHHYYISHYAPNFGHYLLLVLFLGVGGFNAFFPETAWYLSHALRAWQYKSIEPSADGLTMTRVGGVIVMIMGVIVFFMNWS